VKTKIIGMFTYESDITGKDNRFSDGNDSITFIITARALLAYFVKEFGKENH
jgi:hypothetical protein